MLRYNTNTNNCGGEPNDGESTALREQRDELAGDIHIQAAGEEDTNGAGGGDYGDAGGGMSTYLCDLCGDDARKGCQPAPSPSHPVRNENSEQPDLPSDNDININNENEDEQGVPHGSGTAEAKNTNTIVHTSTGSTFSSHPVTSVSESVQSRNLDTQRENQPSSSQPLVINANSVIAVGAEPSFHLTLNEPSSGTAPSRSYDVFPPTRGRSRLLGRPAPSPHPPVVDFGFPDDSIGIQEDDPMDFVLAYEPGQLAVPPAAAQQDPVAVVSVPLLATSSSSPAAVRTPVQDRASATSVNSSMSNPNISVHSTIRTQLQTFRYISGNDTVFPNVQPNPEEITQDTRGRQEEMVSIQLLSGDETNTASQSTVQLTAHEAVDPHVCTVDLDPTGPGSRTIRAHNDDTTADSLLSTQISERSEMTMDAPASVSERGAEERASHAAHQSEGSEREPPTGTQAVTMQASDPQKTSADQTKQEDSAGTNPPQSSQLSQGTVEENQELLASAERDFGSLSDPESSGPVMSQRLRTEQDADALLEEVIEGKGDKTMGPNSVVNTVDLADLGEIGEEDRTIDQDDTGLSDDLVNDNRLRNLSSPLTVEGQGDDQWSDHGTPTCSSNALRYEELWHEHETAHTNHGQDSKGTHDDHLASPISNTPNHLSSSNAAEGNTQTNAREPGQSDIMDMCSPVSDHVRSPRCDDVSYANNGEYSLTAPESLPGKPDVVVYSYTSGVDVEAPCTTGDNFSQLRFLPADHRVPPADDGRASHFNLHHKLRDLISVELKHGNPDTLSGADPWQGGDSSITVGQMSEGVTMPGDMPELAVHHLRKSEITYGSQCISAETKLDPYYLSREAQLTELEQSQLQLCQNDDAEHRDQTEAGRDFKDYNESTLLTFSLAGTDKIDNMSFFADSVGEIDETDETENGRSSDENGGYGDCDEGKAPSLTDVTSPEKTCQETSVDKYSQPIPEITLPMEMAMRVDEPITQSHEVSGHRSWKADDQFIAEDKTDISLEAQTSVSSVENKVQQSPGIHCAASDSTSVEIESDPCNSPVRLDSTCAAELWESEEQAVPEFSHSHGDAELNKAKAESSGDKSHNGLGFFADEEEDSNQIKDTENEGDRAIQLDHNKEQSIEKIEEGSRDLVSMKYRPAHDDVTDERDEELGDTVRQENNEEKEVHKCAAKLKAQTSERAGSSGFESGPLELIESEEPISVPVLDTRLSDEFVAHVNSKNVTEQDKSETEFFQLCASKTELDVGDSKENNDEKLSDLFELVAFGAGAETNKTVKNCHNGKLWPEGMECEESHDGAEEDWAEPGGGCVDEDDAMEAEMSSSAECHTDRSHDWSVKPQDGTDMWAVSSTVSERCDDRADVSSTNACIQNELVMSHENQQATSADYCPDVAGSGVNTRDSYSGESDSYIETPVTDLETYKVCSKRSEAHAEADECSLETSGDYLEVMGNENRPENLLKEAETCSNIDDNYFTTSYGYLETAESCQQVPERYLGKVNNCQELAEICQKTSEGYKETGGNHSEMDESYEKCAEIIESCPDPAVNYSAETVDYCIDSVQLDLETVACYKETMDTAQETIDTHQELIDTSEETARSYPESADKFAETVEDFVEKEDYDSEKVDNGQSTVECLDSVPTIVARLAQTAENHSEKVESYQETAEYCLKQSSDHLETKKFFIRAIKERSTPIDSFPENNANLKESVDGPETIIRGQSTGRHSSEGEDCQEQANSLSDTLTNYSAANLVERIECNPEADNICHETRSDVSLTLNNTCHDTADIYHETGDICPDTTDICAETVDICPDTNDIYPEVDNICSDTIDICPQTDNISPESGDVCPYTNDMCPDTAHIYPETGDNCPDTIEIYPEAGNFCPDTNDISPETNNICSRANDICPDTIDVCPEADDICHEAGNICHDANDICPEVDDVCSDTNDICPDTNDVCPEVDDICSDTNDICPATNDICPEAAAGAYTETANDYFEIAGVSYERASICPETAKMCSETADVCLPTTEMYPKTNDLHPEKTDSCPERTDSCHHKETSSSYCDRSEICHKSADICSDGADSNFAIGRVCHETEEIDMQIADIRTEWSNSFPETNDICHETTDVYYGINVLNYNPADGGSETVEGDDLEKSDDYLKPSSSCLDTEADICPKTSDVYQEETDSCPGTTGGSSICTKTNEISYTTDICLEATEGTDESAGKPAVLHETGDICTCRTEDLNETGDDILESVEGLENVPEDSQDEEVNYLETNVSCIGEVRGLTVKSERCPEIEEMAEKDHKSAIGKPTLFENCVEMSMHDIVASGADFKVTESVADSDNGSPDTANELFPDEEGKNSEEAETTVHQAVSDTNRETKKNIFDLQGEQDRKFFHTHSDDGDTGLYEDQSVLIQGDILCDYDWENGNNELGKDLARKDSPTSEKCADDINIHLEETQNDVDVDTECCNTDNNSPSPYNDTGRSEPTHVEALKRPVYVTGIEQNQDTIDAHHNDDGAEAEVYNQMDQTYDDVPEISSTDNVEKETGDDMGQSCDNEADFFDSAIGVGANSKACDAIIQKTEITSDVKSLGSCDTSSLYTVVAETTEIKADDDTQIRNDMTPVSTEETVSNNHEVEPEPRNATGNKPEVGERAGVETPSMWVTAEVQTSKNDPLIISEASIRFTEKNEEAMTARVENDISDMITSMVASDQTDCKTEITYVSSRGVPVSSVTWSLGTNRTLQIHSLGSNPVYSSCDTGSGNGTPPPLLHQPDPQMISPIPGHINQRVLSSISPDADHVSSLSTSHSLDVATNNQSTCNTISDCTPSNTKDDLSPAAKVILDTTDQWLSRISDFCRSPELDGVDPDHWKFQALADQCKSEIISISQGNDGNGHLTPSPSRSYPQAIYPRKVNGKSTPADLTVAIGDGHPVGHSAAKTSSSSMPRLKTEALVPKPPASQPGPRNSRVRSFLRRMFTGQSVSDWVSTRELVTRNQLADGDRAVSDTWMPKLRENVFTKSWAERTVDPADRKMGTNRPHPLVPAPGQEKASLRTQAPGQCVELSASGISPHTQTCHTSGDGQSGSLPLSAAPLSTQTGRAKSSTSSLPAISSAGDKITTPRCSLLSLAISTRVDQGVKAQTASREADSAGRMSGQAAGKRQELGRGERTGMRPLSDSTKPRPPLILYPPKPTDADCGPQAQLKRQKAPSPRVSQNTKAKPTKMLTMREFEQAQQDRHLIQAFARIQRSKACVDCHMDSRVLDRTGPSARRRRERVNYNCLIALENVKFLEMLRYKKSAYSREEQLKDFKKSCQTMAKMGRHPENWAESRGLEKKGAELKVTDSSFLSKTRPEGGRSQIKQAAGYA